MSWDSYTEMYFYSDEEYNLLVQDKLWIMCLTSPYGYPSIFKMNKYRSDEEHVGYIEYFCGAECSGSIERSKIIMYGSYQDLHKKLDEYKKMHEMIEDVKSKLQK